VPRRWLDSSCSGDGVMGKREWIEFSGGRFGGNSAGVGVFGNIDPAGRETGFGEMRGEAAIEGFGEPDHAFEGEVGPAAEELGDIGLADAEPAGEVGLADAAPGHGFERLLGEVRAGGLDFVVEGVAGPGEDVADAGELLSGFAHSGSICLDFLAVR
jgi:hypothetical protein